MDFNSFDLSSFRENL